MIQTKNVRFAYNATTTFTFPDITCAAGEALLLIGESGRGKTTFLHLLGGLLQAKTGDIQISKTNLSQCSAQQLDQFRGRNIGIIFQQAHFIHSLSVEENLLLSQYLAKMPQNKKKVTSLLMQLKIGDYARKKTYELSVGEQQRVAIARALLNEPKVILADEPTASLDDRNAERVIKLLQIQARMINAALIIVTHDQRVKSQVSQIVEL